MADDKVLNPPIVIDLTGSPDFSGHGVLKEVSAVRVPTGDWLVNVKPLVCEDDFGLDYIRGRCNSRLVGNQGFESLVPVRVERPGTGKYFRRAVLYLPRSPEHVPDWILNTDFGAMFKMWRIIEQQRISVETIRKKMQWTEQQVQDKIVSGKFDTLITEAAKQMLLSSIADAQKGSSSRKLFPEGDKEK